MLKILPKLSLLEIWIMMVWLGAAVVVAVAAAVAVAIVVYLLLLTFFTN